MKLKTINELIERRDELTSKEKTMLINGILSNKKAKTFAINGAILQDIIDLALAINNSTKCENLIKDI